MTNEDICSVKTLIGLYLMLKLIAEIEYDFLLADAYFNQIVRLNKKLRNGRCI